MNLQEIYIYSYLMCTIYMIEYEVLNRKMDQSHSLEIDYGEKC